MSLIEERGKMSAEERKERAKRLLWVDDDGEQRFQYEIRKLQKLGYEIRWARTGKSAVELLQEEEFGVVLLDQQLPWDDDHYPNVWGGVLLLAWCRAQERPGAAPAIEGWDQLFDKDYRRDGAISSRILVISAFFDDRVAEARETLGVPEADTLSKPVDFSALHGRLPE